MEYGMKPVSCNFKQISVAIQLLRQGQGKGFTKLKNTENWTKRSLAQFG
jgi:hypothetical protein